MKKNLFATDWFTGIVVAIAIVIAGWAGSFDGIERVAYDWGVRGGAGQPSDKVAVIAIDERSIENIGRWPWPRSIHAKMLEMLGKANPKAIGYSALFFEPQQDPGLEAINQAIRFLGESSISAIPEEIAELDALVQRQLADEGENTPLLNIAELLDNSLMKNAFAADLSDLVGALRQAQVDLDTDQAMAAAVRDSGKVVLPFLFAMGMPQGRQDQPPPPFMTRNTLNNIDDRIDAAASGLMPPASLDVLMPIPLFGEAAAGLGHLNTLADVDGAVRTEPLVVDHYDAFYPSMALMLAAKSLNLGVDEIQVLLGEGVRVGRLQIGTEADLQMHTAFYPETAFPPDSFYEVLIGKIPLTKYAGKIVLIGPTAAGLGTTFVTPVSSAMQPVQILAHTISSILNEDFFTRPTWAFWAEAGVFLFVTLFLTLLLPRLKAGPAAGITLVLAGTLLGTHYGLMTSQAIWLQLMTSLTLLVIGYLVLVSKRFFVAERGKLRSDMDSAESNRMLGMAFQGQGQLDMAFEKFRKLERDDSVMELLYNLALDYERKRQFNKAHSVYSYIAEYNPKFRDLEGRLNRARKMEETVIFGAGSGGSAESMMLGGDMEKPMLGRYEIQKELGKGAMGVVYLGIDPKINRTVAIKTMALSQEFDEDELVEVKERFFREAETAGRLNHPNIVTIYDAGEEHDLAYIAMEFLDGHDLVRYTKPDKLLPIAMAMEVVAKCADALTYAHHLNVVHRDIKPANIMYLPKSKELKITDFGIARITDSSKTKTGVVLGTPSYMSPEQLAGKKIDGRSDLFSLGVMLFQLLSGQLPFKADSMATLMYKIANDTHQPVRELRPELPPCVQDVIDKAMAKDLEQRYQNGSEMAKALRACLRNMLQSRKPA